mmetsp:Transcript_28110/g.68343  ORF Transcript_28110/g.68343 Transcript_28110/m.68343 type:complete len:323 (+) Transcript_28110:710-1678(+)
MRRRNADFDDPMKGIYGTSIRTLPCALVVDIIGISTSAVGISVIPKNGQYEIEGSADKVKITPAVTRCIILLILAHYALVYTLLVIGLSIQFVDARIRKKKIKSRKDSRPPSRNLSRYASSRSITINARERKTKPQKKKSVRMLKTGRRAVLEVFLLPSAAITPSRLRARKASSTIRASSDSIGLSSTRNSPIEKFFKSRMFTKRCMYLIGEMLPNWTPRTRSQTIGEYTSSFTVKNNLRNSSMDSEFKLARTVISDSNISLQSTNVLQLTNSYHKSSSQFMERDSYPENTQTATRNKSHLSPPPKFREKTKRIRSFDVVVL